MLLGSREQEKSKKKKIHKFLLLSKHSLEFIQCNIFQFILRLFFSLLKRPYWLPSAAGSS